MVRHGRAKAQYRRIVQAVVAMSKTGNARETNLGPKIAMTDPFALRRSQRARGGVRRRRSFSAIAVACG
jgi:hypothetical protein